MNIKDYLSYAPITGKFTWIKNPNNKLITVGQEAGTLNGRGYLYVQFQKKRYLAHRLAWSFIHGYFPIAIDHINHDKLDNSIGNLREINQAGNNKNRSIFKNNTSGATGVTIFPNGKWRAAITVNKKKIHLGMFTTIEEAIEARAVAKDKYSFHENHV